MIPIECNTCPSCKYAIDVLIKAVLGIKLDLADLIMRVERVELAALSSEELTEEL